MKRGIGAAILGAVGVAFILVAGHAHAATAQQPFNLVVSPLPINLTGKPGTTLSTDIRLKNGGNTTEHLKVTLMKFSAYGDTGKPSIQDRAAGDDYFDWVTFSPKTFDAPPNVWQTVHMSIALPKTAAFGYYYAAVFSRANEPKVAGKQNVLVGSTAVLVLVNADVPGANRTTDIVNFTANKHFYEFLPATFTVRLHNVGNVHAAPTGNIFVKRGGKTLATLQVNAAVGNILPKSYRVFTASWGDGFPAYVPKTAGGQVILDKNDKPVANLDWDFSKISKLRFGHYSAQLVMAYDNGKSDVPLQASVSFWVIPWRILFVLLLVVLFAGIGIWSVTRGAFKKVKAKKQQ